MYNLFTPQVTVNYVPDVSGANRRHIGTSKRNVDFHIGAACRKLNVATRIQAVVMAASGRLIEP